MYTRLCRSQFDTTSIKVNKHTERFSKIFRCACSPFVSKGGQHFSRDADVPKRGILSELNAKLTPRSRERPKAIYLAQPITQRRRGGEKNARRVPLFGARQSTPENVRGPFVPASRFPSPEVPYLQSSTRTSRHIRSDTAAVLIAAPQKHRSQKKAHNLPPPSRVGRLLRSFARTFIKRERARSQKRVAPDKQSGPTRSVRARGWGRRRRQRARSAVGAGVRRARSKVSILAGPSNLREISASAEPESNRAPSGNRRTNKTSWRKLHQAARTKK